MSDRDDEPPVQRSTGPEPTGCVLWLHGLGADGHDFLPIVPLFAPPRLPPLRFLFPHAPKRAVTINNGLVMRAWYDVTSTDFAVAQDRAGIRASAADLRARIADLEAEGVPRNRIVVAGFSQGGAIALYGGLTDIAERAAPLGAIVALSTYLPLADGLAELGTAARHTPILQAHGSADPIIPISLARQGRDLLQAAGASMTFEEYPMAHSVDEQEIDDVVRWLAGHLQTSASELG